MFHPSNRKVLHYANANKSIVKQKSQTMSDFKNANMQRKKLHFTAHPNLQAHAFMYQNNIINQQIVQFGGYYTHQTSLPIVNTLHLVSTNTIKKQNSFQKLFAKCQR